MEIEKKNLFLNSWIAYVIDYLIKFQPLALLILIFYWANFSQNEVKDFSNEKMQCIYKRIVWRNLIALYYKETSKTCSACILLLYTWKRNLWRGNFSICLLFKIKEDKFRLLMYLSSTETNKGMYNHEPVLYKAHMLTRQLYGSLLP